MSEKQHSIETPSDLALTTLIRNEEWESVGQVAFCEIWKNYGRGLESELKWLAIRRCPNWVNRDEFIKDVRSGFKTRLLEKDKSGIRRIAQYKGSCGLLSFLRVIAARVVITEVRNSGITRWGKAVDADAPAGGRHADPSGHSEIDDGRGALDGVTDGKRDGKDTTGLAGALATAWREAAMTEGEAESSDPGELRAADESAFCEQGNNQNPTAKRVGPRRVDPPPDAELTSNADLEIDRDDRGPLGMANRAEMTEIIETCLDKVARSGNPKGVRVLRLRHFENWSWNEIAARFGVATKTTQNWANEAMRNLRNELQQLGVRGLHDLMIVERQYERD